MPDHNRIPEMTQNEKDGMELLRRTSVTGRKEESDSKRQELWELAERFIREQKIRCAESVYQSDRVIENAYEFIECVCSIVGYHQD